MPRPEHIPTYEELRAERAREWSRAQAVSGANHQALQQQIAEMPDVKHAPESGAAWRDERVHCVCGGGAFEMRRWITCNGYRHRMEVLCTECETVSTWDWERMAWLTNAGT